MIYSKAQERFFNDLDDVESWLDDYCYEHPGCGRLDIYQSLELRKCRQVWLHERLWIADVVDERFGEEFEDYPPPNEVALKELQSFYEDWCRRHNYVWFEPTKEPFDEESK